jgi:hypothetical protein
MRTNILIGTTAINRPKLHYDNMPDWIKWICELNEKQYNIKWFVNIDIISSLEATFENTKDNFDKLINNRIDVVYLTNESCKGNFLEACKRISRNIMEYSYTLENTSDLRVIWLEDDWKLDKNNLMNINDLINNYSTQLSHINLTFIRNNYIWALAPSIMGFELWKKLHYDGWEEQTEMIDPEHCIGKYCIKLYGKEEHLTNLTILNKQITQKYYDNRFLKNANSSYTYSKSEYVLREDNKYVKLENIKDHYKDKMVFMRITPTFCIGGCDYGRKFMENHNLYKSRKQNENHQEFYNEKSFK